MVLATATGTASSTPTAPSAPAAKAAAAQLAATDTALVTLQVANRAAAEALIGAGTDLPVRSLPSGAYQVDMVLTGARLATLQSRGVRLVRIIQREGEGTKRYSDSVQAAQARTAAGLTSTRRTLSAVRRRRPRSAPTPCTSCRPTGGPARGRPSSAPRSPPPRPDDPDVEITVTWRTADGRTGSFPLERFEDANEYQYHFTSSRQPLPAHAGVADRDLEPRRHRPGDAAGLAGSQPPPTPVGYQKDFIAQYMTPEDVRARIARLARQYPALVDVINLPNKTQGYRRTASGYLGDPATAAIVVESRKFGDQGWNGVRVRSIKPPGRNHQLTAHYANRLLTVSLATDRHGAVTSTTGEVAAYLRDHFGTLFRAFVEDGSAGKTMPVAGPDRR